MLKKSKFNKILWDKQELIIYNSLSGKIYKTSNLNLANNIENILCNNVGEGCICCLNPCQGIC